MTISRSLYAEPLVDIDEPRKARERGSEAGVKSALIAIVLGFLVSACASLPTNVERESSTALAATDDTRLGRAIAKGVLANPGRSGIYPLSNARDAFAARVLLARAADRSLDLQYYVWHDDTTGRLLFEEVWRAAERGVRVRMLLDDANTKGLDTTIAVLDAHPNIEIRLFNPFANRGFRLGDFATDFARVNRRMHNKSFTADNQVAIVGGRNVGDEYYGADTDVGFVDLDVLAVGPVVREVSREFDLFWNSESAFPAASVIPSVTPDEAARLLQGLEKAGGEPSALRYMSAVRDTPLVRQLLDGELQLEWTTARVVHDDPSKVLQSPERTELHLLPRLEQALGRPMRELDLVSPYFVPGAEGTASFGELGKRGVKVRVLTNSLAGTDVAPVHAGYSKYRQELLRGGARLYELKPKAETAKAREDTERRGLGGSSATGLHAKTFSVDRSRIFVGSFNLDPRSKSLNTEMGVVLESATLANMLSGAFDTRITRDAYEVRLAADGRSLEWIDRQDDREIRYTTEPETSAMRRLWIDFLSTLPIEWLL
jgi:putative cardiolipin synthase